MRYPFDRDPRLGWDDPFEALVRRRRARPIPASRQAAVAPEPFAPAQVPRRPEPAPPRPARGPGSIARPPAPRPPAPRPPAPMPVAPAQPAPPPADAHGDHGPTRVPRAPAATPAPDAADAQRLHAALADLDAARSRVERDAARVKDETRIKLVLEIVPVLDNLDRSIAASERSPDQALVDGVKLVRDQLLRVVESYGVERVDATGAKFDPREHDAVGVVEVADESQVDSVVEQWQPAYRLGERVLRPARVRVGRRLAA